MDVYETITNQIISQLEKGTIPWKKPWVGNSWPTNLATGKKYSGVNVAILSWCTDFTSPYWVTYKQANQLGGHVKRGSKGTSVVYWNWFVRKIEVEENGQKKIKEQKVPFLKTYTVFNINQCEGLEKHLSKTDAVETFNPIEQCEKIVAGYRDAPKISHANSDRACYRPKTDSVHLPRQKQFTGEEEYYSTLYHELVHSTGHQSRLNRKGITGQIKFASDTYSEEELVAEFGAAFLCGISRIEPKIEENSVAYIRHWLEQLRNDKKLAIFAAGQAGKAVDYILG